MRKHILKHKGQHTSTQTHTRVSERERDKCKCIVLHKKHCHLPHPFLYLTPSSPPKTFLFPQLYRLLSDSEPMRLGYLDKTDYGLRELALV